MSGLKNIKILTVAGMLTAIAIIAGFFKIAVSDILEIRFSTLPIAVAGAFLGPGAAAVVGAAGDIGGFLIRPTGPYFPGFTLSGALTGLIFGLCLHKKDGSSPGIFRVISGVLINAVLVKMLLDSLWLSMLYGKGGVWAVLSVRFLKELVMIPVNIILIMAITGPVFSVLNRSRSAPVVRS